MAILIITIFCEFWISNLVPRGFHTKVAKASSFERFYGQKWSLRLYIYYRLVHGSGGGQNPET